MIWNGYGTSKAWSPGTGKQSAYSPAGFGVAVFLTPGFNVGCAGRFAKGDAGGGGPFVAPRLPRPKPAMPVNPYIPEKSGLPSIRTMGLGPALSAPPAATGVVPATF